MKTNPSLNSSSKDEIPHNGKTEAFLFIKKRIEAFGKYGPETSAFISFALNLITFVSYLFALLLVFLPPLVSSGIAGYTIYSFVEWSGDKGTYHFFIFMAMMLSVLMTIFALVFSLVEFNKLLKKVHSTQLFKFIADYKKKLSFSHWDSFAKSFGFSYKKPNIKNLIEVQDFVFWQMQIAKNFANYNLYEDLSYNFNKLTSASLTNKEFKEIVPSVVELSNDLFVSAMRDKDFMEIYNQICSEKYASLGVGDFSDSSRERLLNMIKSN